MRALAHRSTRDPSIAYCTRCRAPLQRTSTGQLADGIRAHYAYIHPDVDLGDG